MVVSLCSIMVIYCIYYICCVYCHKINSNRGESYIDSPNWVKKEKQQ